MYKTATSTNLIRISVLIIWFCAVILLLLPIYHEGYEYPALKSSQIGILILWSIFWIMIFVFRLRNIEVSDENIIIKNFSKKSVIKYIDIESLFEIRLIRPKLVALMYRNIETNESVKILFIPESNFQQIPQKINQDCEMTSFIKKQINIVNPNFINDKEPLGWITVGLAIISGVLSFFLPYIFLLIF